MNSRTFAEPKNKNSTTFAPVFGKKLPDRIFTPESVNKVHELSSPNFGRNFGDVKVESPSLKQSRPLSLSGPDHYPFSGACHTCTPRFQTKMKINKGMRRRKSKMTSPMAEMTKTSLGKFIFPNIDPAETRLFAVLETPPAKSNQIICPRKTNRM